LCLRHTGSRAGAHGRVAQALIAHYTEAVSNSVLPVGLYDRGRHSSVVVPGAVFAEVVKDKKVCIVKDSTSDPERMNLFLSLRKKYSHIKLFDGDEFACLNYLKAGYDGLLLGGGIVTGFLANQLFAAVKAGDLALAEKIESRMIRVAFAMYGGKQIKCWLTGLKTLLVALKVFGTAKTYFEQTMTASCRIIFRLFYAYMD